jgi:hypothetical protein
MSCAVNHRRSKSYHGRNRPGRIPVPAHCHPLVRVFVAEMNDQRATFAQLAGRTGVGIDTMRFWPTRHMPRLDTFEAALNTLGLELVIRRADTREILDGRSERT